MQLVDITYSHQNYQTEEKEIDTRNKVDDPDKPDQNIDRYLDFHEMLAKHNDSTACPLCRT
jgi:hypothetical protein